MSYNKNKLINLILNIFILFMGKLILKKIWYDTSLIYVVDVLKV